MNALVNKVSDSFGRWIGSNASIIFHTIFFVGCLLAPLVFAISSDSILLILTTLVSLEAIYLAIFIQRSVNEQSVRLTEVEESIDDVEEALDDVEEALDDVEEALDEVEEGLDDVEEALDENSKSKPSRKSKTDSSNLELTAIIADLKSIIEDLRKK